ncbi:MAG: hypothetical protein AB8C95_09010 [Phycisphaeraceae bacterium]
MNKQKILRLMLLVLFACVSCTGVDEIGGADTEVYDDVSWQLLSRSSLAEVFVERALYEREADPYFYMQVRIENVSDKAIYVDLDDYGTAFHPNQWGVLETDHRTMINERRLRRPALDDARRQMIRQACQSGTLTEIAAGSSLTYFHHFNNRRPGRFEIYEDRVEGEQWLYVSIDGYLEFTDGQAVEQTGLAREAKPVESSDVIFAAPLVWKDIPRDALIVKDN